MSAFASTRDVSDKTPSFDELGPGLYGYTAEGGPNSCVVMGDSSVLVVDAQATPFMAKDVIALVPRPRFDSRSDLAHSNVSGENDALARQTGSADYPHRPLAYRG